MKNKKQEGYKMKLKGIILPILLEPNGKMENFKKIANDKNTLKEYKKLKEKLKADPDNFGKKLREIVWKGKTLEDIHDELLHERSKG